MGVQFETLTGHGGVHGTVAIDAIHDKAYRSAADARGSFAQAIGTSYGDRTSKLRGLTDAYGRSRLIILLSGNINDMTVAGKLIETAAGRFDYLIVDRSCDANAIRAAIAAQGAEGVILSTSSRLAPIACESDAYRAGNLVESLRCRLRDWRCRNMMRQAR